MQAFVHSQYGNPEVPQVATLERPVPQKNEVRVRVKAAGRGVGIDRQVPDMDTSPRLTAVSPSGVA